MFADCPSDLLELIALALASPAEKIAVARGKRRSMRCVGTAQFAQIVSQTSLALLGRMRQVCQSWRAATFFTLANAAPAVIMRRLAHASHAALTSPALQATLLLLEAPNPVHRVSLTAARRECFAAAVAENSAVLNFPNLFGDVAGWCRSRKSNLAERAIDCGHLSVLELLAAKYGFSWRDFYCGGARVLEHAALAGALEPVMAAFAMSSTDIRRNRQCLRAAWLRPDLCAVFARHGITARDMHIAGCYRHALDTKDPTLLETLANVFDPQPEYVRELLSQKGSTSYISSSGPMLRVLLLRYQVPPPLVSTALRRWLSWLGTEADFAIARELQLLPSGFQSTPKPRPPCDYFIADQLLSQSCLSENHAEIRRAVAVFREGTLRQRFLICADLVQKKVNPYENHNELLQVMIEGVSKITIGSSAEECVELFVTAFSPRAKDLCADHSRLVYAAVIGCSMRVFRVLNSIIKIENLDEILRFAAAYAPVMFVSLLQAFKVSAKTARIDDNFLFRLTVESGNNRGLRALAVICGLRAEDARRENNLALRLAAATDNVGMLVVLRDHYELGIADAAALDHEAYRLAARAGFTDVCDLIARGMR